MTDIIKDHVYAALFYDEDSSEWKCSLHKTLKGVMGMRGYGDFAGWSVVEVTVPEAALESGDLVE